MTNGALRWSFYRWIRLAYQGLYADKYAYPRFALAQTWLIELFSGLCETPRSSCQLYKARLSAAIMLRADCVNRTPGLILWNLNYVQKVVFSLEILPDVAVEVVKGEMIGIIGPEEACLCRVPDTYIFRVSAVSNGTSLATLYFHLITEIVLQRTEH